MAERKIVVTTELSGVDEVKSGLADLKRAVDEVTGAEDKQADATAAATEEDKKSTRAAEENTSATKENTSATTAATTATQGNTAAQQANTRATKDATAATKKHKDETRTAASLAGAFQKTNSSLARLMRGDLAGAAKDAAGAVKEFGKACMANPWIAAITAGIAVIKGLASAWKEAQERAQEYAESLKWAEDFNARADKMRHGAGEDANPFAGKTDEQLEREARAIERYELPVAEEAANRWRDAAMEQAETARNQSVAGRKWRGVGKWVGGFVGADVRTEDEKAKRMQQGAEGALEEEQGVRARLQAIRDEQARRKQVEADAKTEKEAESAAAQVEAERGAAAQARFEAKKRYDAIADEAERNGGNGKVASMTAQKADLEAAAAAEQNAEKRVELLAKAYDLERKIAEAVSRETADTEKQAAARQQRQAEWERKRRLDGMEAPDKVKALEAEIAQLRRGPRTADTETQMRRAIDERDAARKEVEADEKATADKKRDWLHRKDTDGERLASIRAQLAEAKIGGDEGRMLEMMMMGEEIADGYEEELTPRQRRRAEKRAERDAKTARREARQFRKQIGEIEAGWKAGDATAVERVAAMTATKQGVPSTMQITKEGRIVEVKGQDRTNQLLEEVVKALA
jgi:hypothetical protein